MRMTNLVSGRITYGYGRHYESRYFRNNGMYEGRSGEEIISEWTRTKGTERDHSLSIRLGFHSEEGLDNGRDSWNVAPVNKKMPSENFMGNLISVKDRIRSWLSIHRSNSCETTFTYLGTKVGGNMSKEASLEREGWNKCYLVLSRWKMKLLSIGGRFTLLKSVRFFNGQEQKSNKASWVKWNKVLTPKDKGGLGVSSLFALNEGDLWEDESLRLGYFLLHPIEAAGINGS
ncbi:hypothetical protein Tco_0911062 [Tanacetum coccineum]|uniref:Uncharacterized protein n=1 Tax=Tanacetum coccineum TaxID=301880 RepID=A0ABQ5CWD2_9ASTR